MNNKSRKRIIQWEKRYKKGMCVYCGKKPFIKNKKGCEPCLAEKYSIQKKHLTKDQYKRTKLYSLKVRWDVVQKYGGKCVCCGESRIAFLTMDHRNNDGANERRRLYGAQTGASRSWYLKLRRESVRDDLQVLCWNCNEAKEHFDVCPHQSGIDTPDFGLLQEDRRRNGNFNIGTKIDWPDDETLINMVNRSNCSEVARSLGVHNTAIRGRLKRRNLYDRVSNERSKEKNQK